MSYAYPQFLKVTYMTQCIPSIKGNDGIIQIFIVGSFIKQVIM